MNDLIRMVTRSVIGAASWKVVRRLGPAGTAAVVLLVGAVYLVVNR